MTIVAVYTSNGLVGRCNAKCYNAAHPECTCICGGVNHGCGQHQAMGNMEKIIEKDLKKRYGKDSLVLKLFHEQLSLGI